MDQRGQGLHPALHAGTWMSLPTSDEAEHNGNSISIALDTVVRSKAWNGQEPSHKAPRRETAQDWGRPIELAA